VSRGRRLSRAAQRERTLEALRRFLREWHDVPARAVSKRLAHAALQALAPRLELDCRCAMTWEELQKLPEH
jgi:hypothetical protein